MEADNRAGQRLASLSLSSFLTSYSRLFRLFGSALLSFTSPYVPYETRNDE